MTVKLKTACGAEKTIEISREEVYRNIEVCARIKSRYFKRIFELYGRGPGKDGMLEYHEI